MSIDEITDVQIERLILVPKFVVVGSMRKANKISHHQMNFEVRSEDDQKFGVYTRQLTKIVDDFSCGLHWHAPSGENLTLVRYNGPSHLHVNKIESTDTAYSSHIHRATERYIQRLRKADGYAEATDRYTELQGAIGCLSSDCNITGLLEEMPQPELF